jgi:antitoxin VapB
MEVTVNKQVIEAKRMNVFQNGRSKAVRIPKEFEFDAQQVEMSLRPDGSLLMVPVRQKQFSSWSELFASIEPLGPDDQFPEIDDTDLLPLDEVKF